MKYRIILSIFFICGTGKIYGQDYSRDVIITTDTTREFNNTRRNSFQIVDSYIKDGIELRVHETPFQVANITSKKKDNLNGFYIEFYLPSNMPKLKGNYFDNDKNGEWFYWNEKGKLLRKEIWKKGKLLTTQKY